MSWKLNPPQWLSSNVLFRKLFLYRKLYLSRTWGTHYSQFGEDETIRRRFPKGFQGFFVDVGCYHPKKYNNTWRLRKNGWRGINIDIDAIKIEAFDIARPDDINIASAVSDQEGELEFWSHGFYSVTTTLDEQFAAGKPNYVKKTTRAATLTTLIDETSYKDRRIDFLSVDCEGHDLEVLKSLDFDRYQPSLIAVELHQKLFNEVEKSPLYQFLRDRGYVLTGWSGFTLLLASTELQTTLTSKA
jgi:FkbM family methyltransferase